MLQASCKAVLCRVLEGASHLQGESHRGQKGTPVKFPEAVRACTGAVALAKAVAHANAAQATRLSIG